MGSRDFGFLTLRNIQAFQPNGNPVPPNQVLVTSGNGTGNFSSTLIISTISVSTIVASNVVNINSINTSSIIVSTISTTSIRDRDGFLGTAGEILHTDGNTIYWAPSGAGTGYWSESGPDIWNNNTGGNVGINNTSPSFTLDITGNTHTSGYLSTNNITMNTGQLDGITTITPQDTLYINGAVYMNDILQISTSAGNGALQVVTQSGNTYIESGNNLSSGSANKLYFTSIDNVTSTMVLDTTTKRVGINTDNPNATLDVNGTAYISNSLTVNTGGINVSDGGIVVGGSGGITVNSGGLAVNSGNFYTTAVTSNLGTTNINGNLSLTGTTTLNGDLNVTGYTSTNTIQMNNGNINPGGTPLAIGGSVSIPNGVALTGGVPWGSLKIQSGTSENTIFIRDANTSINTNNGYFIGNSNNFTGNISTLAIARADGNASSKGIFLTQPGNVGIGTTTPITTLQVNIPDKNSITGIAAKSDNVNTIIGAYSNSNYGSIQVTAINNNNTDPYALTINPIGGDVYIGSTTNNLYINTTNTNTSGDINIVNSNNNIDSNSINFFKSKAGGTTDNDSELGYIYFNGTVSGTTGDSSAATLIYTKQDGAAGIDYVPGKIQFHTTGNTSNGNNLPPLRMIINSQGYVGINTPTPTATLDVNGTAYISSNLTVGPAGQNGVFTTFNGSVGINTTVNTYRFNCDGDAGITGNLNVDGTSISRVAVSTINNSSPSWSDFIGKYCFMTIADTFSLPPYTASDGTIIVFRNITSGNIVIIDSVGPNTITPGKTLSFVYTTTSGVTAGWYSL